MSRQHKQETIEESGIAVELDDVLEILPFRRPYRAADSRDSNHVSKGVSPVPIAFVMYCCIASCVLPEPAYGSGGCRFEPCRVRHSFPPLFTGVKCLLALILLTTITSRHPHLRII